MKRPIYSRWSAVIGSFLWLVAFLTTLVLLLTAAFIILGSPEAPSSVWSLTAILVASILIVGSFNADAIDKDQARRAWRRNRPRWLFVFYAAVFLILQGISIIWPTAEVSGLSSADIAFLLSSAATSILVAALMATLCELLLQYRTPVWIQVRGWKQPPFGGWSTEQLATQTGPTTDLGRWPHPHESRMTVQEAQAYASLASTKAHEWWAAGQLFILLAGAVLGISLASFGTWRNGDITGLLAAVGALVLGAWGIVLTRSTQRWEKRSATYRQYSDSYSVEMESPVRWTKRLRLRTAKWVGGHALKTRV